jgi:hypothetical protein
LRPSTRAVAKKSPNGNLQKSSGSAQLMAGSTAITASTTEALHLRRPEAESAPDATHEMTGQSSEISYKAVEDSNETSSTGKDSAVQPAALLQQDQGHAKLLR